MSPIRPIGTPLPHGALDERGALTKRFRSPPASFLSGSTFYCNPTSPVYNWRSGSSQQDPEGALLAMVYHDMATRAQVLTLKLIVQLDNHQIEAITGIKARTVHDIVDRALKRGVDPQASPLIILDEHVRDAPKSGRPKKQDHADAALDQVCSSRYGLEMACAYVSAELGNTASSMTVWRILRPARMKSKPYACPD